MDIEGVAARCSLGPTGTGQLIAAHHGAESVEQCRHQSSFHRGERDPISPRTQNTVGIEFGPQGCMELRPTDDRPAPGIDIGLTGGHPDPVLEAIGHARGLLVLVHEKNPGHTGEGKVLTTFLFKRPTEKGDIHEYRPYASAVSRLFRRCEEISWQGVRDPPFTNCQDPGHASPGLPMLAIWHVTHG